MKYNIVVPCGLVSSIRPFYLKKIVSELRKQGISLMLDIDTLNQCVVTERSGEYLNKGEELQILVQLYKLLHGHNHGIERDDYED